MVSQPRQIGDQIVLKVRVLPFSNLCPAGDEHDGRGEGKEAGARVSADKTWISVRSRQRPITWQAFHVLFLWVPSNDSGCWFHG